MQQYSVLVLGGASWNRMIHVDQLPQGNSATIFDARVSECAGSTGVGKAMTLAALGCKTTLHCALGRDEFATRIQSECRKHGITMLIDEHSEPTPQHLNIMDKSGGRYSIFLETGAPDPCLDEARLITALNEADVIFLSLSGSSKKMLHLLEGVETKILLDLHDYDGLNSWYDDFIACADIVQLSNVALSDAEPVIARLIAGGTQQVVLTKGADGAEIITEDLRVDIPSCPAVMRDSNGAGDTFSAALWYAQAKAQPIEKAGVFAAAAAAFAVESDELFPDSVSIEMIEMRARKHKTPQPS